MERGRFDEIATKVKGSLGNFVASPKAARRPLQGSALTDPDPEAVRHLRWDTLIGPSMLSAPLSITARARKAVDVPLFLRYVVR
jgi:hypothetical protein